MCLITSTLQAIQSESQIAASLRNRDVFTWHDENSGRSTSLPSRMDSMFNSYDLTHKSLRWMYTIVSDVNSSETKTFSKYFASIYYLYFVAISRDTHEMLNC